MPIENMLYELKDIKSENRKTNEVLEAINDFFYDIYEESELNTFEEVKRKYSELIGTTDSYEKDYIDLEQNCRSAEEEIDELINYIQNTSRLDRSKLVNSLRSIKGYIE